MNYNQARDYVYASILTPRLGHQEYSPVAIILVGLMGSAKTALLKEVSNILVTKHDYLMSAFDLSVSNAASISGPLLTKKQGSGTKYPTSRPKYQTLIAMV